MPDFWRLHGFDWLAGLPELESERLLSRSRSKEYARGEIIFGPASTPRSVYLLEKGLVRIFRVAEQGGEATLGYVSPGEVFGELEAVSDRARESFAQTIRPSVAWRVPIPELRRMIDASPRVELSEPGLHFWQIGLPLTAGRRSRRLYACAAPLGVGYRTVRPPSSDPDSGLSQPLPRGGW